MALQHAFIGWVAAAAAALLVGAAPAARADDAWHFDQRQAVLGYSTLNAANSDGPYNRSNRIAALAGNVSTLEWRADLRLRNDACSAQLGLRANLQHSGDRPAGAPGSAAAASTHDLYGRSGGVGCRIGEAFEARAGRYVLGWGSATLRSPSNPFYADTGKTDPVREQVGVDLVELSWRGDAGWSASLAHVAAASRRVRAASGPLLATPTGLLRIEKTGVDSTLGLVLSRAGAAPWRVGGYATRTVDQALIVFGEAGWRHDRSGLYPVADSAAPLGWRFAAPDGPARISALAGGAFTFESGWTMTVEGLYDQSGYSAGQRDAARRAVAAADALRAGPPPSPQAIGAAYGLIGSALAPQLSSIGQRTLFVQLQRSEWNNRADLALRWAYDIDQRGANWSASLTWFAAPGLELLALGSLSAGGAVQGRVLHHAVLLGLRASF